MGLKYYLNLFKKDSNAEAVKLRYFLNIFVFLVYMVFITAFFSLRDTNTTVSSVFGILSLAALITYHVLNRSFIRLIDRLVAEEPLTGLDETDAAFAAYREGYREFCGKSKSLNRKMIFLNIIWAAAIVAVLPLTIIFNMLGFKDLTDEIFSVASITMFAYILFIILLGAVIGAKNGVWYQEYSAELAVINKYKAADSGAGVKYKILEDKKPNVQLEYLFVDAGLRKRYKKLLRINQICSFLFAFVIVAALFGASQIARAVSKNEDLAGIIGGIAVYGSLALGITVLAVISHMQNKILKRQYIELKTNETKNSLYIRLHEMRTPFYKRWNILFLVCFVGAVASNILFGSVVSAVAKTDEYGWIFFLLFLAELILTFVVYFRAFGKLRLKMIAVEDGIDKARTGAQSEWQAMPDDII